MISLALCAISPDGRSLPNSRAERFHRTPAEGVACLFVASGVFNVFWAFLFVYARKALLQVVPSHITSSASTVPWASCVHSALLATTLLRSMRSSHLPDGLKCRRCFVITSTTMVCMPYPSCRSGNGGGIRACAALSAIARNLFCYTHLFATVARSQSNEGSGGAELTHAHAHAHTHTQTHTDTHTHTHTRTDNAREEARGGDSAESARMSLRFAEQGWLAINIGGIGDWQGEQAGSEGTSCGNRQQSRASPNEGGDCCCTLQREGSARSCSSQQPDEVGSFGTPASANLDAENDYAAPPELRVDAFVVSAGLCKGCAGGGPSEREWGHQVVSTARCEPRHKGSPLGMNLLRRSSCVEVEVADHHICSNS